MTVVQLTCRSGRGHGFSITGRPKIEWVQVAKQSSASGSISDLLPCLEDRESSAKISGEGKSAVFDILETCLYETMPSSGFPPKYSSTVKLPMR